MSACHGGNSTSGATVLCFALGYLALQVKPFFCICSPPDGQEQLQQSGVG